MSQLVYSDFVALGVAGDYATGPSDYHDVNSFNNPSEVIPWGVMCARITGNPIGVKLPSSSTDQFIGVSRRDESSEDTAWPLRSTLPIVQKSDMFVVVDGDVSASGPVFVRFRSDPHVITLSTSASFVTGNSIDGQLNDEIIVTVPFNTDSATTLADLATAIAALPNVSSAIVSGSSIDITGVNPGEFLLDAFSVTGGASQALISSVTASGPSGGAQAGAFRADDDDTGSGAAAVQVSGVRFKKDFLAGSVGIVELNLP